MPNERLAISESTYDSVNFFEPMMIGSAVLVESVFGLNGIGKLAVDSVNNSDLPVITGTTLFAATFIILANVVVDMVYGIIDPRVRLA